MMDQELRRFYQNVTRHENGCWTHDTHSRYTIGEQGRVRAGTFSYRIVSGKNRPHTTDKLLRLCGFSGCVHPDHLTTGTDLRSTGRGFCRSCRTVLPLSNFYKRGHDKHKSACKVCIRYSEVKRKYRLSSTEYDELVTMYGKTCWICKKHTDDICVDHDHVTGEVRGLLCQGCNKALGCVNDDVSTLRSMIEYLSGPNWAEAKK